MNNDARTPRSTSRLFYAACTAWLAALMLLTAPVAVMAQETTTDVQGTVFQPDGQPAAGQSVSITDDRTGAVRRTTSAANGTFSIRGLPVGGPYTIRVESSEFQNAVVTDVFTNLSAAANFDIRLGESAQIEEITVTAKQVQKVEMAIGPGTAFSVQELQEMPSIARQIRDVIRIDPRVQIGRNDNGGGSGINCLGGAPRSNSITIDGALANDGFGLNEGTGTSARFAFPIPFDTIASTSVEFAPLDVQYSQFTGCAINVVTKPGSNEFSGSVFYLYNDDSLTGDTLEGNTVITDPFEDKNYGFNLSGPIIKDHLFFTVAYEETDEGGVQNDGPIGGGFANEDHITVENAELISDILENQYGRDTGPIVRTLPQTSERWFARLDWNINDKHRAEFSYTTLEELNLDPDDYGFDGFTFLDNFEFEGIEQDTISLRLFSNWTENFSSEFRYSTFDVTDIQGPAGGGEAQDPNPKERIKIDGDDGEMISGPGFFRSANDLQYTVDQIKLSFDYVLGDHTLTFGVERETRDIFNLFIPNATGTIEFDTIADLQAGTANEIVLNGSFTGEATDAAAAFERDIDSIYLQDVWQINEAWTLVAGVRFDQYNSSDVPILNDRFVERYGFSNQQTFDGLELVQPRLGLTWDIGETWGGTSALSLGYGVFGGGDPTVHFANAYQNFGGAIGFGADFIPPCTAADLQVTDGNGQFTGLPDCVRQGAANAALTNSGAVAAVDPDFKLPENHRYSIGFSHFSESGISFFDGWDIRADFIYTDHKNAVDWVDLRLTPNGTTLADGRPQFYEVDPTLPGCTATFVGIRQGFTGDDGPGGACDDTPNGNQDVLMTNGVEGETKSFSLQFSKDFQWGDKTTLGLDIGYSWLDATVGNPVNSSTAGSSYEEVAVETLNNSQLGPALWAAEHNFVMAARFTFDWNDKNTTRAALYFQRRSGNPFSYTYEDDTVERLFGDSDDEERVLLYVPDGPSDPVYDFNTGIANGDFTQADVDEFFAFLQRTGLSSYAGSVAPKNGFDGPWFSDLDLRISHEVGLWGDFDHRLMIFFDIENLLNLFSDSGNLRRYTNTGDIQEGVRVLELDDSVTDTFVVTDIFDEGTRLDVDDSVWRIQFGLRYSFN